jgi:hypothetical protein
MSKMDNLRAMREAKYAEAQKRAATATPARSAARPPVAPPAPEQVATRADDVAAEGLCGHRNMSGRTCTRESGHPQKSHRYS